MPAVTQVFIAGLSLLITCSLVPAIYADDAQAEKVKDNFFTDEVFPILKSRCLSCHSHEAGKAGGGLVLDSRNGWLKGGGSGQAVVPGKPDDSLLIQAVLFDGLQMPPGKRLPKKEIEILRQWVTIGAPDPRQDMSPKADPKTLWALQPIKNYAPPRVRNKMWPLDDLDRFVLAKMEQAKIEPNDPADRYTLLRRVTFDLTGLPPTPEEIQAFVNDTADDAFAKVVDRLLDSEGFGDHWARHWLDLSCYADLADISGNMLIRDAWRYRDYVIASLNADKHFDQFILEQLAGDLLPYQSNTQRREQVIATGYLAIGPWILSNYIKKQLDADVVDHQIDRIGKTFLGQTISCARCHDHKFDPIPTRDYYALAGIFHSTLTTSYDGPGVWSQISHHELPQATITTEEKQSIETQLADLRSKHESHSAKLTDLLLQLPGATNANVLTTKDAVEANVRDVNYSVSFDAAPSVWAAEIQATNTIDGLRIDFIRPDGTTLHSIIHKPGEWRRTENSQTFKPASYTYTGDGSGPVTIRISVSSPANDRFGGAIDNLSITAGDKEVLNESFNFVTTNAITSKQAHTNLSVFAKTTLQGWIGMGVNHSHAVEHEPGNLALQLFGGTQTNLAAAKPASDEERGLHKKAIEIQFKLDAINKRIESLEASQSPEYALAVSDVPTPTDSPIYIRGEFDSLGDRVPRGFLSAVSTTHSRAIEASDSGRLQLAHWLVDPANPLTSRVLANRIWQKLFGTGIVSTVDYFGVHGDTPTHPKLLDYLARRFSVDNRWSLKATIRQLVLSRTYQTASSHNAVSSIIDPDNRLYWRMPRRRLSAESIRDAILAISGQLDSARGGSPLGLELPGNIRGLGGNVNPPTWGNQIADYIANRRTIYMPLKRERPTGELEILTVFDFPHPSEITGLRPQTTVATQALFLLNSPFVKHQSVMLAQRLQKDYSEDEQKRIIQLYQLTTGRPATAMELNEAKTFLDACSADFEKSAGNTNRARIMAWEQLCHGMLASNRFLFYE